MDTSFGRWLKRQRKTHALNQADLAQRVECTVATLRKIESDQLRPDPQLAVRLFDAFGVDEAERSELLAHTGGAATARRHNLPTPATTLLGRADDVASASALLRGPTRLLTLIGPGGMGKTRLSIQVATVLLDDFTDGSFFIDLSPIHDHALVLPMIAKVLGLREDPNLPLADALAQHLYAKHLLLVLDNYEQVLPSAIQLAALLMAAPHLKLLVTSRAVLHLADEYIFAVPPLGLPANADLWTDDDDDSIEQPADAALLERLAQVPSVALFVERARAVVTDFALTGENVRAVAAICARLDGLPLAIELAAARSRLFSPASLLLRLEACLDLLTKSPLPLPARHQTLRATIDWSYQLLAPAEQSLFQQLAIFRGGGTAAAVEVICGGQDQPAEAQARPRNLRSRRSPARSMTALLDGMETLLDHSLIYQRIGADGERRLDMLEIIREYALEQLDASGAFAALQARHCAYYLTLAELGAQQVDGLHQAIWLNRLEAEHDNLRAVLSWGLDNDEDAALVLRLAAALWQFWWIHNYVKQGRAWLADALAVAPPQATAERAHALFAAGALAYYANDLADGQALLDTSLTISRTLGDHRCSADALNYMAFIALNRGNFDLVRTFCGESLQLARSVGALAASAWSLGIVGVVVLAEKDYPQAQRLLGESLALFRELGGPHAIAQSLWNIIRIALEQYDYPHARTLTEESTELFRQIGDTHGVGVCLHIQGQIAQAEGDTERVYAVTAEALALFRGQGDQRYAGWVLRTRGLAAQQIGDTVLARECYDESRRLCEQVEDHGGMTWAVLHLGKVAIIEQDPLATYHILDVYVNLTQHLDSHQEAVLGACLRDAALATIELSRAITLMEQTLAGLQGEGERETRCSALCVASMLFLRAATPDRALHYMHEGLALARELDDRRAMYAQMMGVATVALEQRQINVAARLCGAAATIEAALGMGNIAASMWVWPPDRAQYLQTRAVVDLQRSDASVEAAWVAGATLQRFAAVAEAQAFAKSLSTGGYVYDPNDASLDQAARTAVADAEMRQRMADLEAANEQLEAFAYSVSHDLRAPLRAIDGFTNILQEDYEQMLDVEGQRVIGIIRNETGRMGQLIEDLLAFARLCNATLQAEPVDMAQLVIQVFEEVTQSHDRTRLDFQLSPMPHAQGDPNLLRQVWVNLLSNAVKYSSRRERAIIQVSARREGDELMYRVQDNGAGFDMIHIAKLFGVFQRLHSDKEFPGTGVGLAIVQRIIVRHGGRIWAEGSVDQGAAFSFTLPLQPPKQT